MKRKTENYKSLYISDFFAEDEPLYCATLEAWALLQSYKPVYKGVRILADTGRCIKIVRIK